MVNRCDWCNKKYGLIPYKCKCGKNFCIKHRYTDSHNCEFDHASYEREKIKKENPVIIAEKIKKI